jgi:hypothetical protein
MDYQTLLTDIANAHATLAAWQHEVTAAKAAAEQAALAAAGGYKALGSNETERTLALEHALVENAVYQEALHDRDEARLTLEVLEAQAAALRFEQRERDLCLREREFYGVS